MGTAFPAVCHDVNGRTGSTGDADHTSYYLPKNDRRKIQVKSNLKEKWTNLWKNKRQAVEPYEPVCLVSVTFLYRFLGLVFSCIPKMHDGTGMPLAYLFMWLRLFPTALLLLRQALIYIQRRTSDEFLF